MPFQDNVNFPIARYSRVKDLLDIQPVVPMKLSDDWLLISRWVTPVVYQPDLGSACNAGAATGLGHLNPSLFLSPARPGKLIGGFGPTFLLPTATCPALGQGKWGAGPSAVLLMRPAHWTLGFHSNNNCSFAGNKGRPRVNRFLTQYFVTHNMEHGWFLTSSPIITADWRAPHHNQRLVPFGAGFGKMTHFFDQAMVWQMHLYYNAVHPQDLPDPKWQVRLQVALLFPAAK